MTTIESGKTSKRLEHRIFTALDLSQYLSGTFGILNGLDLKPDRLRLFDVYFARYMVLKYGYDVNYTITRPEFEFLSKLPILRNLAQKAIRLNEENDEVAKALKEDADRKEGAIMEDARLVAKRGIDFLGINPDSGDLVDKLTEDIVHADGSPHDLQNLANLLSSAFIEYRKKSGGKFYDTELRAITQPIVEMSPISRRLKNPILAHQG